jgi:tetratricopeptide (TPR) repeat protein
MITPCRMLAKKISMCGAMMGLAAVLLATGCTPAGPSALLKGKKYLDRGDYAAAVAQLKTATTLLSTNAQAWNYYGVALQFAGQPDDAAKAYQTAIKCDRELMEAHYNYGSLALEQGRADVAKSEFAVYTMRRQTDANGWLKLGSAQLKSGEYVAAERSFSAVLSLKQNEAEAYNGLGLARIQRSLPRDAQKFFVAAVQSRPDFASALLNLATVNQQYLHDNKAALESYKKYLALTPRPANWDEVNSLAANLEVAEAKLAAPVVAVVEKTNQAPAKISNVVTQRTVVAVKPQPTPPIVQSKPAPKPVNPVVTPVKPLPTQVVQVQPDPTIVTKPVPNVAVAEAKPENPQTEPLIVPMPQEPPKRGFLDRMFGGSTSDVPPADTKYHGSGLTPLPAIGEEPKPLPEIVKPAKPLPVVEPVPVFARYNYFSPRKPVPGNRVASAGAFTKARLFEQEEKWTQALEAYQQAAALDPSWFEAQYNTGVLAHRLRNYALALPRYEMALAIQRDSEDARYNFALALKGAGFVLDAAEQLKIILAVDDKEVRAHLALANICAQSLRDKTLARQHYQSVLEMDPMNPQAQDIRYWLAANPN